MLDGAGYTNSPKWSALSSLSYDLDPLRFVLTEHYIGAINASNVYIDCTTNCLAKIPSGFISAQYKFMDGDAGKSGTLFISADNLFNRIPPWGKTIPGGLFAPVTNVGVYNTVGTFVRADVRF